MEKYRFVTGSILLALMLMVSMVSAAELKADLNVTKVVSSTGPYAINDTVTWVVTVWNNGPDDATNVTITEDISHLSGHGDITVDVSDGAYDSATGTWTIPLLENATSEELTLVTNFSTVGEKTNKVTVTLTETDEDLSDNSDESPVTVFDKLWEDSQSTLAQAEQANLFLIPLDDERQWYRYHHLFADLLRTQLQKSLGDQGVARLHLRAAWHEQNGLILEAIHHASMASDDEMVERLIKQNYLEMMNRGEMSWVRFWMGNLSKELVCRRPWLCLYEAMNRAWFGQLEQANLLTR